MQEIESGFFRLSKMYGRIHRCDVVLKREKSTREKGCSIEAKLEVPGAVLFAMEKQASFESALGNLIEDLEHQLRKYKEEAEERR